MTTPRIFNAKSRFIAQASRGNSERGLELLDKIDQFFDRESHEKNESGLLSIEPDSHPLDFRTAQKKRETAFVDKSK